MASPVPKVLEDRSFWEKVNPFNDENVKRSMGAAMNAPAPALPVVNPAAATSPVKLDLDPAASGPARPPLVVPPAAPATPPRNAALDLVNPLGKPADTPPAAASSTPTSTATPPATTSNTSTPTTIPMTEQTQTTVSGTQHDPAAVKKLERAQADVQAQVLEGAKVGAAKAAEIATVRKESLRHQQELDAKAAKDELAQQARVDGALRDQQNMLTDLSKSKKDPQRLWKEKGAFAQFAAAISVALGAAGAALAGGRNTAYDIVNSAIERDLDAQESEIQVKRDRVNMQGNVIAQLRASGADDRTARSLLRQHHLEAAASQIEAKAATSPADVQQNAVMTVKQLREKAAAEAEERKKTTITSTKAKAPAYSPADQRKFTEEQKRTFVPDAGGFALSEAQASKMNEFAAAHNSVLGDVVALKALVDKHGNESLPTQAKAQMVQLKNRIITAMNKEAGLGAMSGSDRELIEGQIADPTALFARGAKTSERLGALIETFNRAKLNTYQAYGLAPK